MKDKGELLLEEYKLCQESVRHLESTIWKTSGFIGIGAIGSFLLSLRSISQIGWNPVVVVVGLLIIALSWIWWGMAQRWWTIQHRTYDRMEDIERILEMYQVRYVRYYDYTLVDWRDFERLVPPFRTRALRPQLDQQTIDRLQGDAVDDVMTHPTQLEARLAELEGPKPLDKIKKRVKKAGVQGHLKYFPYFVTSAWAALAVNQLVVGWFGPPLNRFAAKALGCPLPTDQIIATLIIAIAAWISWCCGKKQGTAG